MLRGYLVIPSTPALCQCWARIRAERREQPISVDDAWIAAPAVAHGCPLITHNPSDFRGISGLSVISEVEPGRERTAVLMEMLLDDLRQNRMKRFDAVPLSMGPHVMLDSEKDVPEQVGDPQAWVRRFILRAA